MNITSVSIIIFDVNSKLSIFFPGVGGGDPFFTVLGYFWGLDRIEKLV